MLNKKELVFQVEIKIANTKTPETMLTEHIESVFSSHTGESIHIMLRNIVLHF